MHRPLLALVLIFQGEVCAEALDPLCTEHTSKTWGVPVELLEAIHDVEAGSPGLKHRNKNGSFDLGVMQHNSKTATSLKQQYGVDPESLLWSECYAVYVTGWELAMSAYQHKDWRLAIAAYNAGDSAVSKAVKTYGGIPTDIRELNLPKSTKDYYVPEVIKAWGTRALGRKERRPQ